LLISKVLQNVANGVQFKEEHMASMNDFVTRNREKIFGFFDTISVRASFPPPHSTCFLILLFFIYH